MTYYPEIDGLRALAVLAVIVYHFSEAALPSGFLGVDVFFVISGFVVTASLATRNSATSRSQFIAAFYARRVKRLLPALLVCLVITFLLASTFSRLDNTTVRTGISALFGASNIYLLHGPTDYFAPFAAMNFFTHTWSLGVEEQFYLIFPILCLAPVVWFRRIVAVSSILSLAGWLYASRSNSHFAFYFSPFRFWELGSGVLTYLLVSGSASLPKGRWTALMNGILLVVMGCFLMPPEHKTFVTPLVVLGTASLLALIHLRRGECRTLDNPVAVLLGKMSYSLYLWHWPILVLSWHTVGITSRSLPLQITAILALAWLSYTRIESRSRGSKLPARPSIAFGLATSTAIALTIWTAWPQVNDRLYLGRPLTGFSTWGMDPKKNWDFMGCSRDDTGNGSKGEIDYSKCAVDPSLGDTGRTIFLYGDSHVQQFIPAFERIGNESHVRVIAASTSGCPYWNVVWHAEDPVHICAKLSKRFVQFVLDTAKPGDKLVLSSAFQYLEKDGAILLEGKPLTVPEALQVYLDYLKTLSEQLRAKNVSLSVIGSIPRLNAPPSVCIQKWGYLNPSCDRDALLDQTNHALYLEVGKRVEAAAKIHGFSYIDIFPELEAVLKSKDGPEWYADKAHLSRSGARQIASEIKNAL